MATDRELILKEIERLKKINDPNKVSIQDRLELHMYCAALNELKWFIATLPAAEEVEMWCGAIDEKCRRELFPSKDDAIKCGYEENEVERVAIRRLEGQA